MFAVKKKTIIFATHFEEVKNIIYLNNSNLCQQFNN
jgi:hypothetical protein